MMKLVTILFVIAALLLTLDKVKSDDPPPKFPNIGYIGSTYNLFKGNPHSTKGLDPGFTLRNMFEYTYDTNTTTADGLYSLPDGVNALLSSSCSFSFSSQVAQSSSSYKKSLEVDVSADFSGWGASFSASADYKTVHQGSSSSETKYVTSQAKCEAYAATVQKAKLNPALVSAIKQLPINSIDITPYEDFFNHWGTHYAHNLRMGGRYGVRSSFSSSDFTSMSSTSLDIKMSAKYSGLVSINVNAATSSQKEEAQKFENFRKDFQIYQVGGKPPLNETVSSFEWAQTVKLNPLPLSYNLEPITSIMTTVNFPNDPQIVDKQKSLLNALRNYCMDLGLPDESLCNQDQPSQDFIKVHFLSNYSILCSDNDEINQYAVPVITNPNLYILGTMLLETWKYNLSNFAVEDSPLLSDAKGWKVLYDQYNNTQVSLRPECPPNYFSISDFYICCKDPSSLESCLNTIPRTKPCIADKCLTDCGLIPQFHPNDQYFYGNSKLGAKGLFVRNTFVPEDSPDHDFTNRDLIKCLSFSCLQYV